MEQLLLVEDDVLSAVGIKLQLQSLYPASRVRHSRSGMDAVAVLENQMHPDIVLLDAVLEEERASIEVAIKASKLKIPVIFISALSSDELFAEAIRTRPANYLLKPFSNVALKYAIELALANHAAAMAKSGDRTSSKKYVLFKGRRGDLEKVAVSDILYIEFDKDGSIVYTTNDSFGHAMTIKNFHDYLPDDDFIRINKKQLININHLSAVDTEEKTVYLEGKKLVFSPKYKKDIIDFFSFK